MKKCVLYARVSTDRQALMRDGSLDTQESRLRGYVSCRSTLEAPWEIADVFREEGESGKDTNRPQLQRLLSDAAAGKFNVILCTKIDRITRSLTDFFAMFSLFQRKGIEFISIDESFDTSTATGRAMLKIILVFAELERERTSERTKEKMAWRAQQGLRNGGHVLGYDLDPDHKGVLKPNPKEAAIVNFIFDTYVATRSMYETARRVNAKGYRSKAYMSRRGKNHPGGPLTKTTVCQILHNPVYLGRIVHRGELFPGKHAPIVDIEKWNAVQALLAKAPKVQRKHGRERRFVFKLKGLVRCGECGGFMTPYYGKGRSRTHYYYKCTRMEDGSERCGMRLVPAEELEAIVVERIRRLNQDPALVSQVVSRAREETGEDTRAVMEERERVLRELSTVEERVRRIINFIGDGRATESLRVELFHMEDRKKALKEQLQRVEEELKRERDRAVDEAMLAGALRLFAELYGGATDDEKADLFRLQIRAVIWQPDRLKVGYYGDGLARPGVQGEDGGSHDGSKPGLNGNGASRVSSSALVQRNSKVGWGARIRT